MAVFSIPVVLLKSVTLPQAVLPVPVFRASALAPIAVLKVPVVLLPSAAGARPGYVAPTAVLP